MSINIIELRRSWTRVLNNTVHQSNSLDASVMLEILDRLEAAESKLTKALASSARYSLRADRAEQTIKELSI